MSTMQFASYLLFLVLLPFASALKFNMEAHHGHESATKERCIRNFVAKDQLVVVTANVDGSRGDGQQLNMHVRSHIVVCAIAIVTNNAMSRSRMQLETSMVDQRTL